MRRVRLGTNRLRSQPGQRPLQSNRLRDPSDGRFRPSRYGYPGFEDGRSAPSTRVTEWLVLGAAIDLGDSSLTALSTPGRTPNSAALFGAARHRLFIGDHVYSTTFAEFSPGAGLSARHRTAQRLLATLPDIPILKAAHWRQMGEGVAAPWLTIKDVRDLDRALMCVKAGRATLTAFHPR